MQSITNLTKQDILHFVEKELESFRENLESIKGMVNEKPATSKGESGSATDVDDSILTYLQGHPRYQLTSTEEGFRDVCEQETDIEGQFFEPFGDLENELKKHIPSDKLKACQSVINKASDLSVHLMTATMDWAVPLGMMIMERRAGDQWVNEFLEKAAKNHLLKGDKHNAKTSTKCSIHKG